MYLRKIRTNWNETQQKEKKIKVRDKINEVKTTRIIHRTSETKSWFPEKIDKIDKPLARREGLLLPKREDLDQYN